jgi:uncharacterized protein YeeX (DUF496 family)
MNFEIETTPTLDDSYPVIVRTLTKDDEEYVFQFACNKKELLQLRREINKTLKMIKDEEEDMKGWKR